METHFLTTEGLTFSIQNKTREDQMYIKKVTGSIKGGVDAALTEKTLIIGSNGAGKSAIVNAVELALVGGASDIEGRAWVQDVKRIKRLGSTVNAVATLSDDSTCSYRVEKSKAQHQNGVGGSLPYREVRDALTGSASKAYKYLLNQCAQDLTVDEVKARIPSDLHGLYMSVAGYGNSAVEGLLEAQEVAAKNARDTAKEAKGAKEAANLAGQGLGPVVMESQVKESQIILEAARQYINEKGIRVKIEQYTNELVEMAARQEVLEGWIRNGQRAEATAIPDARERVDALRKVIGYHLEKSSPTCGVCGGSFDATVAKQSMSQLDAWIQKLAGARANMQTELYQNELRSLKLRREHIEKFFLEQNLRTDTVADPGVTLGEAESNYREVTERLGAHAQHQKLQGHVDTLQKRSTSWKALADLLNTLVGDFVDAGMAKFMTRVQGFLADTDVFGIKLTKSDCQVGFIRDGVLTSALSGAEWARLLTAIACACAADGVPVVIPEERMWDRETLATTMRALTNAPCQIILTSTEKPKGKLPAGWSLVEVT